MHAYRQIALFSLALLLLAVSGATESLFAGKDPMAPVWLTFLFVGLLGGMVSRAIKSHERRLEAMAAEIRRLKES